MSQRGKQLCTFAHFLPHLTHSPAAKQNKTKTQNTQRRTHNNRQDHQKEQKQRMCSRSAVGGAALDSWCQGCTMWWVVVQILDTKRCQSFGCITSVTFRPPMHLFSLLKPFYLLFPGTLSLSRWSRPSDEVKKCLRKQIAHKFMYILMSKPGSYNGTRILYSKEVRNSYNVYIYKQIHKYIHIFYLGFLSSESNCFWCEIVME